MARGQQDYGLHLQYLVLNHKCFGDWLPKNLIVSKSKRLTRKAGNCYFYTYSNGLVYPLEICLSENYLEEYPNEVESVLLHEMIHLKLGHIKHNIEFLNEMNRINEKYNKKIKVIGQRMKGV